MTNNPIVGINGPQSLDLNFESSTINSYLNDINYSKHQVKYLNELSKTHFSSQVSDETQTMQRQEFVHILEKEHGVVLHNLVSSSFTMKSLIYLGKYKDASVIVKMSPDGDLVDSVHPLINEWYILSGLNVISRTIKETHDNINADNDMSSGSGRSWTGARSSVTGSGSFNASSLNTGSFNGSGRSGSTKNSYTDSNYSLNSSTPMYAPYIKPKTLPRDITGILYPEKVLNITNPRGGKKYAMIYNNEDEYVTLKKFYNTGIDNTGFTEEMFSAQSMSSNNSFSSLRHNSVPNASNNLSDSLGTSKTHRSSVEVISIISDIINVLDTLSVIHKHGFVHNGLTNLNIIKSTKDPSKIKVAGFEFSFNIQPEDCSNAYLRAFMHNIPEYLPYMSPETITNSHRGCDFRTDFYSMGVILYELLVGRLPFNSDNPSKLLRMHIIHKPVAPILIGHSWVSRDLNDIIMKLLQKDPHLRYSSCTALTNDLITIKNSYIEEASKLNLSILNMEVPNQFYSLKQLLVKQVKIEPDSDLIPNFLVPRKVYGRAKEYAEVHKSYDDMSEGINVIIVHGPSGGGKTTLLRDLEAMAIARQEFYYYWRYKRFTTSGGGGVYNSFVQGIRNIITQILSSNKEIVENWRHYIISNIPIDLNILMNLIPEFRTLIGPKYSNIINYDSDDLVNNFAKSTTLGDESVNLELRIRYLIKSLLGLFAINGLTIFLDDIQYATPAEWSMAAEVMEYLNSGEIKKSCNFKMACAYDSSTKPSGYNLETLHEFLNGFDARVEKFFLGALQYEDFTEFWKLCVVNKNDSIKTSPPTSNQAMEDESQGSKSLLSGDSITGDRTTISGGSGGSKKSGGSRDSNGSRVSNSSRITTDSRGSGTKIPYIDEQITSSSTILYHVTRGNILMLKYIVRHALLTGKATYQPSRGLIEGTWKFKLQDYKNLESPTLQSSIKDLLDWLPMECRNLLKIVTVVPNDNFNLQEILIASGFNLSKLSQILTICIESRLILPTAEYYKLPFHLMENESPFDISKELLEELTTCCTFMFFHDSVRHVLYDEMVEKNELKDYHHKIALNYHQDLRRKHSNDDSSLISRYLIMAKHFSNSVEVAAIHERDMYFQVLIKAGKDALGIYNLEDALEFFMSASKFIDLDDVQTKLKCSLTICQLNYSLEKYSTCLELIDRTIGEFREHGFNELMFITTKISCLRNLKRQGEIIDVAVSGLSQLGIRISKDRNECDVIADQFRNQIPLSLSEVRALRYLPRAQDPKICLGFEIISDLIRITYYTTSTYVKDALAYQVVVLMSEYGSSAYCAIPLIYIANVLARSGDKSKFLRAKEYIRVAMELVETDGSISHSYIQLTSELYLTTIACYIEPMSVLLKYHEVFIASKSFFQGSGNQARGLITSLCKLHLLYSNGLPFEDLKKTLIQQNHTYIQEDYKSLQMNGLKLVNCEISLDKFEESLNRSITSPDYVFGYNFFRVWYLVVLDKFDEAVRIELQEMAPIHDLIPLTLLHVDYYMSIAIALRHCFASGKYSNEKLTNLAAKLHKMFDLWDDVCPENFHTKNLIIKCVLDFDNELSSLDKLDLFEEAIEFGDRSRNYYDVAWANCLCAEWLIRTRKSSRRIRFFIANSLNYFKSLGLDLNYNNLKLKYQDYLKDYNWAGIDDIPEHRSHKNSTATNLTPSSSTFSNSTVSSGATAIGLPPTRIQLDNSFNIDISTGSISPTPLHQRLNTFFSSSSENKRGKMFGEPIKSPTALPGPDGLIKSPNKPTFDKYRDSTEKYNHNLYEEDIDLNQAVKACLDISNGVSDELILIRLLRSCIRFSEVDYGVIVMRHNDEPFVQAIGTPNNIYNLSKEPLSSRMDLCPFSLIMHVFQSGEIVNKDEDNVLFQNRFSRDDYYQSNTCLSMICIPLQKSDGITAGAIYLESQNRKALNISSDLREPFFNAKKRDLITLLCSQATVSLTKVELYSHMENAKRIAEDATAEKASFLANMSHEIRTPFNSLLSCSIFLLDTDLNKTQREYVETIRSSAMVTLNIIDGILAFSKIEHGSFTLENEPFSLIESIENAIQLVGEQAALNNLELVFFNRCRNIKSIYGDETRFRQIIINLVGNAVKFTSQGHIAVEVSGKQIMGNRYEISVSVEDTGIGIPKDSTNKVFGAFSQVDSSSRRVYGGSGLGLAISKKLADLMGGTLTFDSTESQGSTFYFVVNAEVELISEPEIKLITGKESQKVSTVIIDSHRLTRQSLKENLEWFGLNIDLMDSVEEFQDYDLSRLNSVFVHYDQFDGLLEVIGLDVINKLGIKLILISQFGKSLPKEIDDNNIFSVLLVPFQKPKIIELIRNLKNCFGGVAPEPVAKDVVESSNFAAKYPLKILLAEDNFINLKVALQHLKKLGYDADHAKDGVEVIDKCLKLLDNHDNYDVIFMDIQMPRKDGITTAIELKELFTNDNKQRYLPEIVALTANVAGEDRQRSLDCGMIDFVPKPILPANLINVLKKIGERRLD